MLNSYLSELCIKKTMQGFQKMKFPFQSFLLEFKAAFLEFLKFYLNTVKLGRHVFEVKVQLLCTRLRQAN